MQILIVRGTGGTCSKLVALLVIMNNWQGTEGATMRKSVVGAVKGVSFSLKVDNRDPGIGQR